MENAPLHTPSPWVFAISQNPHKDAFPDNPHWEVKSQDMRGKGDFVANVWAENDARIITAAPEMLAALKVAERAFDRLGLKPELTEVRAALAKAGSH